MNADERRSQQVGLSVFICVHPRPKTAFQQPGSPFTRASRRNLHARRQIPANTKYSSRAGPSGHPVRERLPGRVYLQALKLFAETSRENRGVTLMEMLVVLAIIGLLAGISFPSLSAGIDSVRMVSATDSIASFLNAAVNRAERRQEPIELQISTKDNALKLYSNEPGFTRELKMPEGVRIEAVLPKETDEENDLRKLILLPGASVPGIGIQVANRRGSRRIVRLDPMTGFPRVESVISQ